MENYNEKEKSKIYNAIWTQIIYMAIAMSQFLPAGDFKWKTENEINNHVTLATYKDNSNKGLILEVNLEYPKELHNLH